MLFILFIIYIALKIVGGDVFPLYRILPTWTHVYICLNRRCISCTSLYSKTIKKRLGGDATWGLILEPGKSPRRCGKLTVSIVFLVDGRTRECFFSQATRRVLEEHIFATEELQTITWKTHITYWVVLRHAWEWLPPVSKAITTKISPLILQGWQACGQTATAKSMVVELLPLKMALVSMWSTWYLILEWDQRTNK